MIYKALRWLSGLDRSYFFALSAVISAAIVSITLTFAPIATIEYVDGTTENVSLLEQEGAIAIIWLLLPVFIVATPLISLPQRTAQIQRNHKINGMAATFILLAFVFVSIFSFGLYFVPALIFSVASTVSLYVGRGRGPAAAGAGASAGMTSGNGEIRMSRSARRRAREAERLEREGQDAPEEPTPLESSRRRRGRRRRRG